MIETETRQPVAAPPSRYRTIRRKLANTPTAATIEAPAAPIAQSSSSKYESNHNHHNSSSHPSNATSQPMTRQPSKFRQILRLNTKEVSPPPAPIPQSAPAALPRPNKLTKSHSQSPPKKVYTKRDEIIDQTLEKLMGSSATEKYSPYNELVSQQLPSHPLPSISPDSRTCIILQIDF